MADNKAATAGDKPAASSDAKLKHSESGVTTRDDALDSGVPMLAGDPSEPTGPEDALGDGPKRGDYAEVVGDKQHYHSVVNPDHDGSDPNVPRYVLEHQNPFVANIGDKKGKKGGVNSAE